jgi:SHS family lactate transporter-like MFS transporter
VVFNYEALAEDFEKTITQMTLAVTLVLMFRPLGAAIFGIASDKWGRKWPFIVNCVLLIVFELATAFCDNYHTFLAVRTLFGIAMGGMYGNAATTALEDSTTKAVSGLLSGMYQSGYPFGSLLAVLFWDAFTDHTRFGWKPIFWLGACFPVVLIVLRLCLPETDVYTTQLKTQERASSNKPGFKGIIEEFSRALRHWLLLLYLILLLMGLMFTVNFFH